MISLDCCSSVSLLQYDIHMIHAWWTWIRIIMLPLYLQLRRWEQPNPEQTKSLFTWDGMNRGNADRYHTLIYYTAGQEQRRSKTPPKPAHQFSVERTALHLHQVYVRAEETRVCIRYILYCCTIIVNNNFHVCYKYRQQSERCMLNPAAVRTTLLLTAAVHDSSHVCRLYHIYDTTIMLYVNVCILFESLSLSSCILYFETAAAQFAIAFSRSHARTKKLIFIIYSQWHGRSSDPSTIHSRTSSILLLLLLVSNMKHDKWRMTNDKYRAGGIILLLVYHISIQQEFSSTTLLYTCTYIDMIEGEKQRNMTPEKSGTDGRVVGRVRNEWQQQSSLGGRAELRYGLLKRQTGRRTALYMVGDGWCTGRRHKICLLVVDWELFKTRNESAKK